MKVEVKVRAKVSIGGNTVKANVETHRGKGWYEVLELGDGRLTAIHLLQWRVRLILSIVCGRRGLG